MYFLQIVGKLKLLTEYSNFPKLIFFLNNLLTGETNLLGKLDKTNKEFGQPSTSKNFCCAKKILYVGK